MATDVSFMNEYHSKNDLEYANELKEWNEHLTQKKMEESEDSESTFKPFKHADVLFNDSELTDTISNSPLSLPEDMIENRFNKFSRYGYLDPAN